MSRYLRCDNDYDHRREAERDFRFSSFPDREHESQARYDSESCGAAYMDRFDQLRRERYEREESEQRQEAAASRREREDREFLESYEHYMNQPDDSSEYDAYCAAEAAAQDAAHFFRAQAHRWLRGDRDEMPF